MRKGSFLLRSFISLGLAVLVLFGVWTLSLPAYADLLIFCCLLPVLVISEPSQTALLGLSFYACLVILNGFGSFTQPAVFRHYRAHEKYDTGQQHYRPHVFDKIHQPYGDLVAVDPSIPSQARQPREIVFKTDRFGLRNDRDYHAEKIILVGDSFIVADGTDQKDMLSNILKKAFHLDVYNLAFMGAPMDYASRSTVFYKKINSNVKFAFFLFEGNDFLCQNDRLPVTKPILPKGWELVLNRYDDIRNKFIQRGANFLSYPKIIGGMARRVERLFFSRSAYAATAVYPVAGRPVVFYVPYLRCATAKQSYLAMQCPRETVSRLACVFFIPDKSRVYKDYLPRKIRDEMPEPAAALVNTRQKLTAVGVPVIDLTPALRARARHLAKEGRYVFWRDDTHWNQDGIRAVAPMVARTLRRYMRD